MGLKKPLFLKVDTASVTESQTSSFRPGASASVSLQSFSGDLKLVSSSYQEYKFTEQGLHKTAKQQPGSDAKFYEISDKDVEILEPIGEGASATVYKGYIVAKDCYVAVKCINCLEKEKRKQIMNDIRGLSDVSHPSLVQFIGAYRVPDKGQVSIVMEYLNGGSLADLVKRAGTMPEAVIADIAAQTLEGLVYLHKYRHTVHRDIKPANLLLSSGGAVKIADFGISAFVDNTLAVCNTFLGTVTYMSPERINSQPYSFAADIWSLGLSLLECAMGKYPYDATAGPLVLMMQVLKEEVPMPGEGCMSVELRDFLLKCVCKDPYERMPAEALLLHPFITKAAGRRVLKGFMSGETQEGPDFQSEPEGGLGAAEAPGIGSEYFKQEALQVIDRHFAALSAGSRELETVQGDLSSGVVLVHEGVESRGRRQVMGSLRGICDLQAALGANRMIVDLKHVQTVQGSEVLVHVSGHIEVTDSGPLGAALWGQQQASYFASVFELARQENGCLGIQTCFFRHM